VVGRSDNACNLVLRRAISANKGRLEAFRPVSEETSVTMHVEMGYEYLVIYR
jgi:hypothetical protein